MVETRSGRSVSPHPEEASPEGSEQEERAEPSPRAAKRRDTAGTTGVPARAGPRSPRGRGRGAGAGGSAAEGHPLTDSQAYTLLALALVLAALPCVVAPKLAARVLFGSAAKPAEDQHGHVLGLVACGLAAAASLAFALEECARRHMLHNFTADTLKLALAAFAGANIGLQVLYPATLTAPAAVGVALLQAVAAALPASQLFAAPEDRGRVARDFRRLPHALRSAAWLRRPTLPGALYLLLTAALPAAGLAYLLAPEYTLYHTLGYVYGASTLLPWRAVGGCLLTVLPALTYTLKDKAENELLGRPLARALNLGLAACAAGHLAVLGPVLNQGHGGWMLPGVAAAWGTALLAALAGLAAPEAAALVEQTAEAARNE